MRILVAVAATLIAFPSASAAEDTAAQMLAKIDAGGESATFVTIWLDGNDNGASWANTILEQRGQRPLFCPPGKLAITADQDVSILRRFVKERPEIGDVPAGFALLLALADTFPCK